MGESTMYQQGRDEEAAVECGARTPVRRSGSGGDDKDEEEEEDEEDEEWR